MTCPLYSKRLACGGGVDDSKVFGLEISKMVLESRINENIPCKVKNSVHLRLGHIKNLMKLLQIEASDANIPRPTTCHNFLHQRQRFFGNSCRVLGKLKVMNLHQVHIRQLKSAK